MSLHIQIHCFEGPLPLLLHLIKREDMDIFEINIHEITKQYLDYIKTMKQLDLEVVGEFITMAATLIHIKSRMLLPQYDEEGEEAETEDPRRKLVQKLLEYQTLQEISKKLYTRPLVGRDVWLLGTKMTFEDSKINDDIVLEEDNALFALISTYRMVLRSMKKSVHRVSGDLLSVGDRIWEIKDRIKVGQQVPFSQLIDSTDNRMNQVLVTFLSLLELARMGFVSLFQSTNFEEIYIHTHKVIDIQAIERAENYEIAEGVVLDRVVGNEAPSGELQNEEEVKEIDNLSIKPPPNEKDKPFEVKAATDEEIAEEEALLNLRAEA